MSTLPKIKSTSSYYTPEATQLSLPKILNGKNQETAAKTSKVFVANPKLPPIQPQTPPLKPTRWWELINSTKKRPLNSPIPYQDLKEYIKGEPTLTQFIHWNYWSDLDDPIQDLDRDLNILPWRKCLNRVNETVKQNLPVDKAQMEKFLQRPVTCLEHFNANQEKWLNDRITDDDYVEFIEFMTKNYTTNEQINWFGKHDLASPITDSIKNQYPWRKFINFFNKTFSKNLPVAKDQLEKLLNRPVKWSELANCNHGKRLDSRPSYNDFLAHTNRNPNHTQFLNWFIQSDLDHPFSEERICAYPWRRLIELIRKPEERSAPIKAEELKRHFLDSIITWADLINCNLQKNLTEETTLEQFYEYYQSCNNGNLPEIEAEMAWFTELSIEMPIEADDFDTHPWRAHINIRKNEEGLKPVSKEELEELLGREVTPAELENCNTGKPLSAK